jgi:hypothetical protein
MATRDGQPDEPEPTTRDEDEGLGGRATGVEETDDEETDDEETDEERAERVAREVARDNPDPTTRREAMELELADEDLSDEGGELGQHND